MKKVQAIQRMATRHKLSVSEIEVEEGHEYFTPVSNAGPKPGFKLTWKYAV